MLLPSLLMTKGMMLPPGAQRQTQQIERLKTHGEMNLPNKLDTTLQISTHIGQDCAPTVTAASAPSGCMAHSSVMSVASS